MAETRGNVPRRRGRLGFRIGAVFGKEARISSRRRRSFALRFGYLGLLTLFVVLVWLREVRPGGAGASAMPIARMSEAGKGIIGSVVWFQFVAAQLAAVVLLSTSVSEEIYRGTMGPLLSTPLSSFQIVSGKLLGGLLQVLVLLGISLPLLAVVRVFGGVPWGYVVGGVCITITSAVFAGTVTILFSILLKRAHGVIVASLGGLVALNLLLPLVLTVSLIGTPLVPFVSGPVMLWLCTSDMRSPGGGGLLTALWPLHCVVMLAVSFVLLLVCARAVRTAARRRASGEPILPEYAPLPPPVETSATAASALARLAAASASAAPAGRGAAAPAPPAEAANAPGGRPPLTLPGQAGVTPAPPATGPPPLDLLPAGADGGPPPLIPPPADPSLTPPPRPLPRRDRPIRRVIGSPIFWKELQRPLLPSKAARTVVGVVATVLVLMTYVFLAALGAMGRSGVQTFYLVLYVVPAVFCMVLLSGTTISSEKESRCWPLLLTTTIPDAHILAGKIVGVLRRGLPLWVAPVAHALFWGLLLRIHPIAIVHVLLMVCSSLAFCLGLGVYCSARLRRTTTALMVAITVLVLLWVVLPLVAGLTCRVHALGQGDYTPANEYSLVAGLLHGAGPLVQSKVIADGATGAHVPADAAPALRYHWRAFTTGAGGATALLAGYAAAYGLLAVGLLWRAGARLRRDIF